MSSRNNRSAFTLLEIMLVVTIIGLLLAAAIYKMTPSLDVAKQTRVEADVQMIKTMLLAYSGRNGFYPTTEQGLKALVMKPDSDPMPTMWTQLMDSVPKDPWGTEYIYRSPGQRNPDRFDLFSEGPDRIPDTADDNWGGQ